MTRFAIGLLGSGLLALCAVVAEAAETRPYLAGSAFYVSVRDADFNDAAFPGVTFTASAEAGLGLRAAIGAAFANTFRGEVELAYRTNDLDELCAVSCAPISGELSSLAFMANGYYDMALGGPVRPYLGLGVGLANVEVSDSDTFNDADDDVFAYQAMVGLGFAASDAVTLQLGYRYFATEDPTFFGTEFEYATHNLEAGIRIGF